MIIAIGVKGIKSSRLIIHQSALFRQARKAVLNYRLPPVHDNS